MERWEGCRALSAASQQRAGEGDTGRHRRVDDDDETTRAAVQVDRVRCRHMFQSSYVVLRSYASRAASGVCALRRGDAPRRCTERTADAATSRPSGLRLCAAGVCALSRRSRRVFFQSRVVFMHYGHECIHQSPLTSYITPNPLTHSGCEWSRLQAARTVESQTLPPAPDLPGEGNVE